MNKNQLRIQIENLKKQLNSRINTQKDLQDCQKLSEQLDQLIEQYMEL